MYQSQWFRFFIVIPLIVWGLDCKPEGPYIEIGGMKLTEEDLAKEMPESYQRLKQQYDEKIKELLVELAHRKMFEKEAKEQGISVEEYMQKIQQSAKNPTQQEIDAFYQQMVKSGQAGNATKKELEGRIFNYLKQGKVREAFLAEVARLKKKYNYNEPLERFQVNIQNEPFRGNPNGKIVVVEFSDFECPFCLRSQKTARILREKYKGKIKWVFKDFPLDFHPHAMDAHIAANCVYRLKPSKFWDYYDELFNPDRTKEDFKKEVLRKKALSLGISSDNYDRCISNPEVLAEIKGDIQEGNQLGVTGTPAFFINGRKLKGAVPLSEFESIIQDELTNH